MSHYMMEPESLERFRAAVADDRGKALTRILTGLAKKGFEADSHDTLKRVPKASSPTTLAPRCSGARGSS